MGCGKTTVSKALAEKMDRPVIDLDAYIVEKTGQLISEIFEEIGEDGFRKIEHECLQEIVMEEPSVIATGGGIIVLPENIKLLQQMHTIFLDYPFDILYERIKGDQSRPLVTTYAALHKRYQERLPVYNKACKLHILGKHKSVEEITYEVIKALEKAQDKEKHIKDE